MLYYIKKEVTMKPLFSIDITENKKNEQINGAEFITAAISDECAENLASSQSAATSLINKGKLSVWLEMLKLLLGCFGFMIVIMLLPTAFSIGFGPAFSGTPALSVIGILCLIGWGVLFTLSKIRKAQYEKTHDEEAIIRSLNEAMRDAYAMLGVPEDTENVDVLMFRYKVKDGVAVPVDTMQQVTKFTNIDLRAFVKDGHLCLADLSNVYSFRLDSMKSITKINKRVHFPTWNKEVKHNELMYKPYKITLKDNIYSTKPYYVLTFEKDGEEYGIYFPPYELSTFERLAEISVR